MTNFQGQQSTSRLRWLTPERALFFIPILSSIAVAVALLGLAAVPIWRGVRERQVVVEDLSLKSLALPQLERDLLEQQTLQVQLEGQEARLIKMLAGTKDLDTFLAGLNGLAVTHQVAVATTEPGEIEVWIPPMEPEEGMEADFEASENDLSNSGDPLLQEGLEKRSASITVEGAFDQVLGFLRDLESLEVFVIPSDLAMEAIRASGQDAGATESITTKLEIQLSAYGRGVQPVNDDADVTDEVQP